MVRLSAHKAKGLNMTIKQLGGVFGRNPTFNDVTIEGQLTFDGDIDVGSDLKIDGDLNVIGTTTLDGPVDVNMGNDIVDFSSGDSGYIKIQHVSRGGDYRLKVNGATADYLDFQNGASQKLIRMAAAGDVTIYNNLVMSTAGAGIDFSATAGTGTSELFDDYEEGTWTPTITDLTNTVTATSQGTYTKVGRHVVCGFRVSASSLGSASGAIYISGLPFTVKNDNGARCTGAIGFTQNLNLGSAGQTVTIFPSNNQVYAALNVWDATVGTSGMQASELSATGALWGSLEYFV